MALRLRHGYKGLGNPCLSHLFSSSSDGGENDKNPPPYSSYFSDVKASLRQSPPPRKLSSSPRSPFQTSPLSPRPSKIASLDEIRKNLSEFRRRSAAPQSNSQDASSPSSPPSISFQELYKRNVLGKTDRDSADSISSGTPSFESIRESLRQLRPSTSSPGVNRSTGSETLNPLSLKALRDSLKLKPPSERTETTSSVLGPESVLPSIFEKELGEKTEMESRALKTEFLKMYSYGELGEKLKMLRPVEATTGKKNWFSLEELNERLMKLREMEEKESESRIGGVSFKDLRDSLVKLRKSSEESSKKSSSQRLAVLGQFGGQITPSFMLSPPKDHLVEKYFHPENMSSEEKLKLELKRVRDEFKMSESDCGSSRVQVAQLTTKIKHLSSVLHKKDKHSRKGLLAMVQRRKKLLKYLRRTDWGSYCLVLDKLGLRDNPDYRN